MSLVKVARGGPCLTGFYKLENEVAKSFFIVVCFQILLTPLSIPPRVCKAQVEKAG